MESLAEFLGLPERKSPTEEATALEELSPQDFCRGILRSAEYRQSVLDRIKLGTLPPGIERWLWETAADAPDTPSHLEDWTLEQLETQLLSLTKTARELRQADLRPSEDDGEGAVH